MKYQLIYSYRFIAFFLVMIFSSLAYGQELKSVKVELKNKTVELSAYKKNSLTYISTKEFCESFGIPYYFNPQNQKIELRFNDVTLKITAKNPFIVITPNNWNKPETRQLPVSTIVLKNQIYIPLEFTASLLADAYGEGIGYTETPIVIEDKKENEIEVSSEIINLTFSINEMANGTLLTINGDKKFDAFTHEYKDGKVLINLKNINVNPSTVEKNFNSKISQKKGIVNKLSAKNDGLNTQLIVFVNNDYSAHELIRTQKDKELLLTIHNKKFVAVENKDAKKNKWNFDVIVLDAGHGGKDMGAIGVNGAIEKEINLAVTLKVGKLLEETINDVKIVYTRKNDTFVELYKRGKIANESGGKLFVSIHCNSVPKKNNNPRGFEVYLLRPGKTDDAIAIAERENSVIQYEDDPKRYQALTDENFILVSMAHSAYMKYSEKFSEMLEKQFRLNTKIPSRGVKQAGFYVLVGASMPSVLIELGFVSNSEDAEYLKSKNGQEAIATAIVNAIQSFKTYYELVIQE